jgi:hypothetical protein
MSIFHAFPHAPEFYMVSFTSALILGAWEFSNGHRGASLMAILAAAAHLIGPAPPVRIFTGSLMLPALIEVRQSPSEEKDLVRGCLAALVLACNTAVLIT